MPSKSTEVAPSAIEAALEVERQAERDVAAALVRAEERLRVARAKAQAILQRADERTVALRSRALDATEAAVSRLEHEAIEEARAIERRGLDAMQRQRALTRVARWLLETDAATEPDGESSTEGARS